MAINWTSVPSEQVKPGDTINVGRAVTVLRIDPYNGPFKDEGCFGIARWVGFNGDESGMTLWTGDRVEVAR